ncbi:MAG: alpha/beta fold hydrolase [Planctomycetaceae bacterium]|jgi:pimeloyl-ACP methyl ester carboxylesterase|nr:alpha/beta fold hydrolase [Planctomycetaceae bacterium]
MKHYKIDTINVFVEDQGTGQPILFIHGFPFDHTIWSRTCNVLSTDFRVIAPDLRGLGKSELPNGYEPNGYESNGYKPSGYKPSGYEPSDYEPSSCKPSGCKPDSWSITSMEQFADDLHVLLQTLGISEKVILCGLSMGGYIVMQYARKYGNELAGIVLCSTKTVADPPTVAENRRKQASGLKDGTLELRSIADTMIPKLFAEETLKSKPEIVQELRMVIESNNPRGVAAATLGMAERSDTTELLGELDIPVLVVCGLEDQFSPPSEMKPIAQKAKRGKFVEIPNAGHLPPLEQPEQFAVILKEWALAVVEN